MIVEPQADLFRCIACRNSCLVVDYGRAFKCEQCGEYFDRYPKHYPMKQAIDRMCGVLTQVEGGLGG